MVCVVSVWCLCDGGCVVVQCVPLCRGVWCCLPSSAALVPPSLSVPRVVVRAVVPWPVAMPPSPRAPLALVRLLPCWRGTLLLLSLLRGALPFPLLSAGRPSSLACIFSCLSCVLVCGSAFLVPLVLSVLCGHGFSPSLLLRPVRQRMDGSVGCCRGGGCDNDMCNYASLAVGPMLRRQRYPLGPLSALFVSVAVSRFISIPLVRRWRPTKVWLWTG